MNYSILNAKTFLIVAIICCFLSVITTLGIHSSIFDLGNLTFEQGLTLPENNIYILKRFWIIVHCLFVLISMWGFYLIQFKKSPGFIGLGFAFFGVFAFTEIFRQMFILFYLNNLRRSYLEANEAVQEIILINMDHAGLLGYAMFGLFIVAFSLGSLFYGIGLLGENKIDRSLAFLLIIWGIGNLMAFANEFWQLKSLTSFLDAFSLIYQPVMRFIIGLWMLSKFYQLNKIERQAG